eukprot:COSAG06_NODE_25148_length_643_cov_60.500000_1_plen_56_part_10
MCVCVVCLCVPMCVRVCVCLRVCVYSMPVSCACVVCLYVSLCVALSRWFDVRPTHR